MKFCQKICNKIKGLFYKNSEPSEVMDNVVNSMFLCQPLYDKLKKKCHPDRFLDKEKNIIATGIFAKIVENKYNYQELLSVKKEAESKLNIKI